MELLTQNVRLVQRAYWLIRLRWIAAVCVGVSTYFCSNILEIDLQDYGLYGIAALLILYNAIVLLLLKRFAKIDGEVPHSAVKKIITFQMSADLLILTVLLHFSGGIENPLVFYFVFHMIIASILVSVRESYLQATFAVLLFGLLVLLEYTHLIPHHCLVGFVHRCLHRDSIYILGNYFVFVTTLYLVVYMTTYIAVRLKQAEQAYMEANRLLREKDRIKDEYVSRVTHDIKGHLASIQSCLDVVVNNFVGTLNERQSDFIGRAHSRTGKLTKFVKMLLNLTQMRLSGKLEMDVFSLKGAVSNVVAAVKARAENKSITLTSGFELSSDKAFGNQFSIEEMITNLLLNAIKYTPENGTVSVNAGEQGDTILVEVVDTGIGIPGDEVDKVFDEFFRASNAKKSEKDGTGLGLSIVKQIVERHGGKISVQSREGQGTTFTVILPKGDLVPDQS